MKRIYAVILLFSFLVGTLQPIMPMIEYQLHEGGITELLNHTSKNISKLVQKSSFTTNNNPSQHSDDDKSLINDNFYPLAVDISTPPRLIVFRVSYRLYPPVIKNISSPTFLPNLPPPRLS